MKPLPQFVRRLPYVFYALAVMLGGWRVYNDWTAASLTLQYAEDSNPMGSLARSTSLYWGFVEASYTIASAAMLQVLIAIYDKIGGGKE